MSVLPYSMDYMLVGQYLDSTKYCSAERGTTKAFQLGKDILPMHTEITYTNYPNEKNVWRVNLAYET